MSWEFWARFIPLEEAVEVSGAKLVTIKRLLHNNVLWGHKKNIADRLRWMVNRPSLLQRFNSETGFALDLPGPKIYLSRQGQTTPFIPLSHYWVMVHHYGVRAKDEEFTAYEQQVAASSICDAARAARSYFGDKALVVRILRSQLTQVDEEWTLEF
jgi:hypothetical protein